MLDVSAGFDFNDPKQRLQIWKTIRRDKPTLLIGSSLSEAWKKLQHDFKLVGLAPKTYVLDNEKSKDLLESFESENIAYQLSPPYKHRNNQAKRAI